MNKAQLSIVTNSKGKKFIIFCRDDERQYFIDWRTDEEFSVYDIDRDGEKLTGLKYNTGSIDSLREVFNSIEFVK